MKFSVDEFKNQITPSLFSTFQFICTSLESRYGSKPTFSILCISTNDKVIQMFKKMIEQVNGRMLILDESKNKLDNIQKNIGYLAQTISPFPNLIKKLYEIGNDININSYDIVYIDIDELGKEMDPHEIALDTLEKLLMVFPKIDKSTIIIINTLSEYKPYLEYIDNLWLKLQFSRSKIEGSYVFYEKKV